MLLSAGLVEGRPDAGVLAAGQVVGLLTDLPSCEQVVTGVVHDASRLLRPLAT